MNKNSLTMHAVDRLEEIIDSIPGKLLMYSEAQATKKPAPGKWSKKEILGHLIDSASNNHQRFVRMQLENGLKLLQYEQDGWINVQHYNKRKWAQIIDLWWIYNIHLQHVIMNMDVNTLQHTAEFPETGIKTLQFIVDDYVDHMEHHLKQILI